MNFCGGHRPCQQAMGQASSMIRSSTYILRHRLIQTEALTKYGDTWVRYETIYNTIERVQEVKMKKEELHSLNEQSRSCLIRSAAD